MAKTNKAQCAKMPMMEQMTWPNGQSYPMMAKTEMEKCADYTKKIFSNYTMNVLIFFIKCASVFKCTSHRSDYYRINPLPLDEVL